VDVVLVSGDPNRTTPAYSTTPLTWAANVGTTQYINIDPDDNLLCDDFAYLTFNLQNPSGGTSAYIGAADTHILTIEDDNMGYDDLAEEDFEVALPAEWISTPSGRWSRTNTDAVASTGYSLGHNTFGSNDSSSIALSIDTMPLTGVHTTWRFQVRFQADGQSNSHWMAFLSANSTNLRDLASLSGYAIGFNQNITGGSTDPLCLFKVTNGARTVLINTGLDWVDNVGANDAVSIEVTLDEDGEWSVRVDLDGGFNNLTSYGTPTIDLTFPLLNAFGARFNFTNSSFNFTNSSAGLFRIDDISITQKGCEKTWYSQGTGGNSDDAIWWSTTNGGPIAVSGSRYDRFVIQSGDDVVANGLWIADDVTIESGATLTGQANTDLRMFGDWFNEGNFVRGTSNVTFRGTENQVITGDAITRFYNPLRDSIISLSIMTEQQ